MKPGSTLDTWRTGLLVSICEENHNNIEVTNFGIIQNAGDLLKHSKTFLSSCWWNMN